MSEREQKGIGAKMFLKSMLYTACAIALIVIGYFSAGYFFG